VKRNHYGKQGINKRDEKYVKKDYAKLTNGQVVVYEKKNRIKINGNAVMQKKNGRPTAATL
jgi:hypothetical protein